MPCRVRALAGTDYENLIGAAGALRDRPNQRAAKRARRVAEASKALHTDPSEAAREPWIREPGD